VRWFIFFPLKLNGHSQAGRICLYLLNDEKNGHKFIMKNDILGGWKINSPYTYEGYPVSQSTGNIV
jgi:hypothetical protein